MKHACDCKDGCDHDDLEPTSGGYWTCPECGKLIDETTVQNALCPYHWHDGHCTKDTCPGYTAPPAEIADVFDGINGIVEANHGA